jgi:hypothetical protein
LWNVWQQASWLEFLGELDTKINERKMCGLDDIIPGILRLSAEEQRHLTGLCLGIGKKDLPKGRELKDNLSIIHKTLLMAVQSLQYRKPKVPFRTASRASSRAEPYIGSTVYSPEQTTPTRISVCREGKSAPVFYTPISTKMY